MASRNLNEEERRAYVVDDDLVFRNSLLLLLETAGWQAQGFASAADFLQACKDLPPAAVLLDVRMPEMTGLELLELQHDALVKFAVIIITGHGDVETAVRCLKSGAVDFIEKPFSGTELLNMLEQSYSGLLFKVDLSRREHEAAEKVNQLSRRENDVLCGLVAGASHKLIARNLGISDRTVEMYRNNLVRKLGARSTNEAIQLGILAKIKPAIL